MKVYLMGAHGQSNTNGKTIVTIELLPEHTDMSGITLYNGKHLTNPFYRQLKVNAGHVVMITDLEEKNEFKDTVVAWNGTFVTLKGGSYFYLEPSDSYLTAYQYKLPVLEETDYVARGYNGVAWSHYTNGNIRSKKYYKAGNLHSCFYYRDDPYNTLEKVKQYNNGRLDCEFEYDAREALVKQNWYNSKGAVYHKIKSGTALAEPEPDDLAPPASDDPSPPAPPAPVDDPVPPATPPAADPDPWSGLGNNMGAMRLKPREESESASDSDSEPESDTESHDTGSV
jgi:hypothetical protein